ncbi:sulfurtransferase [Dokdonella sp.]|uniref:sulfurtransferase n=1 Tax=Dokdonella sp. TaxID=2291710 RepID=UPI0025BDA82A|nr:sulfurtransferase [Dokdonella sp.]MBX3692506.1 sulfurtransferase [Dokdonella sp.]MCW5568983.1 sulfurtransferase [Dokdonella sp.]
MSHSTLVSADTLAARIGDPDLLIIDCRADLADPARARALHAEAHVPGAVHADLERDLADLSRPGLGRHPMPDAAAFAATLSRWGWRPGMNVVAYDDAQGALAAARLWWMLRLVGASDVAVLDGGLAAWRAAGHALEAGVVERAGSKVAVDYDGSALVDYAGLEAGLAAGSLLLVDARAEARYRGEVEPIDRVAGHVPGALNRPFTLNLDGAGRFKHADALRAEFAALIGGRDPRSVVHMCGSGVTACHNLLAMEHAGLAGSRLFAPSWSGWIGDPARPVACG